MTNAILNILSDIDRILAAEGELIPNIYILEWKPDIANGEYPQREKILPIRDDRHIRVKSITATSFDWVFEAFGSGTEIHNVDPKLLRALVARTFDLIRHDIPRRKIEVDFEILERAAHTEGELAKLYGITSVGNPQAFNIRYPYSLTALSKELGYDYWYHAHRLIEKIADDKGINIKHSDNAYHCALMNGEKVQSRRYSEEALELLRRVEANEHYDLAMGT